MNLPIYRAKKIDIDEWVEGYYVYKKGARGYENHSISYNKSIKRQSIICDSTIDQNTLAIHFPNSSNTSSEEKRWYNMNEISNIIKEYENGNMATD